LKVFTRDTEAFAIDRAADAPGLIHRAIDPAILCRKPVMLEIACDVAPLAVPSPRPGVTDEPSTPKPRNSNGSLMQRCGNRAICR
jgi:TPP-dependent 2-oxoacid decarboxylase